MKVGFIGAGKVGFTLGKYFCEHDIEVTGYYSRSIQSAKKAAAFTATAAYENRSQLVADSDVLFFTVPDDCIASTFEAVRHEPIQGKIFCHCSGVLTASVGFPSIEQAGASGYSVHPLFAISDRYQSYRELADVFFTLEGSSDRLASQQEWLKSTGLHVQIIPAAAKMRYHCAAAIASNQVVALFAESQQLLLDCGFSAEAAQQALMPLFLGNARHIAADGPTAALTGPIERGDAATLKLHLAALDTDDDRMLYLLLSERLLRSARQKHPERDYTAIQQFIMDRKTALQRRLADTVPTLKG
jgi:predicted short-subunit dehydrogenase-like oxidoreductase (DUF2520 family)